MNIRGIQCVSLGLICLAVIQTSVTASPAWRTDPAGQAPTTYQKWTFDDASNPSAPEINNNPYGPALATITVTKLDVGSTFDGPAGWYSTYLGRSGVWVGDTASAELTIPNNPIANTYKEIWVEVGCRGHFPPDVMDPPSAGYGLGTGYWIVNPTDSTYVDDLGFTFTTFSSGWRKLSFGFRIYPNPASETIGFTLLNSGADIDYITVDTICIPEPMTLVLLGLGGLFCTKLRRV